MPLHGGSRDSRGHVRRRTGADQAETSFALLAADCAGNAVTTEASISAAPAPPTLAESGDVDAALLFRQLDFVDLTTGVVTDGSAFDDDFSLAGLDDDRVTGTLYALGTFELAPVEESTSSTTAATDVGPAEFDASLFIVEPATAEVTEVAPLSEPDLT